MKQQVTGWVLIFGCGGLAGAGIVGLRQGLESPDREDPFAAAVADAEEVSQALEPSREALLERIAGLESEIERLRLRTEVAPVAPSETELSEAQLRRLKRDWVAHAIESVEHPRFSRRSEREQARWIESLGLTPDQAMELARLVEQRDAQRRLVLLRSMGVLSEQEAASLFAELSQFDFDLALSNLLSDEQKAAREAAELDQRERGVERVTEAMANRLGLTDGDRFSPEEQGLIQDSIRTALDPDSDLFVPPSIADLPIHELNQRILSAGFQQLDEATFEKLYESVVEVSESGQGLPRGAGRGRRNPAP